MKDIEILLENVPGSLALLGETLGKNNISWKAAVYFKSEICLSAIFWLTMLKGQRTSFKRSVSTLLRSMIYLFKKLRQDVPGQLGMFCRRLADAGISILVQYSDHSNQLIVVVDDFEKGKLVSERWMKEWWP